MRWRPPLGLRGKSTKGPPAQPPAHDLMEALREAHAEVLSLQARIREYEWLEGALRRRTRELNERWKEAQCLYRVSSHLIRPGGRDDQRLRDLIAEMPSGWQEPDATFVRLVLEGQEYLSPRFRETPLRQRAPIWADGREIGLIEVCLPSAADPDRDPPLCREKQELLDAIARWLGEWRPRGAVLLPPAKSDREA
ncbi:MAG: hypothetical protein AB1640_10975 [bacterium]